MNVYEIITAAFILGRTSEGRARTSTATPRWWRREGWS
jgi:hypothetical protein